MRSGTRCSPGVRVGVRASIPASKVRKVINNSAALTNADIVAVYQAAVAAGADFVKTSIGFHPAGAATVHAVGLMKRTVGDRTNVKASGGCATTTMRSQ